jgi:glycogen phosphorylase
MPNSSHPLGAAYFSMEIALEANLPTYAGGLGILAGDTLRSAADMGVPMAGVTLLYRKGYFAQHLDAYGNQTETPSLWNPESVLQELEPRISLFLDGQNISVRAWQYTIESSSGRHVPVYLLDTALPENTSFAQTLTDQLYNGDEHYRLCQEAILGLGGIAMLRQLGHHHIMTYHMNEGHPTLLALALWQEYVATRLPTATSANDLAFVRKKCVFTTHTPVPAGHDQFPRDMVLRVLGAERTAALEQTGCLSGNILNMTELGLHFSHYINGVAMQHGEVSRGMFPDYSVRAITNGVHAETWTAPAFQKLYDLHIPEWRRDNLYFRYAIGIPLAEICKAHALAKEALIAEVAQATGVKLNPNILTLGFARRATAYKRADLLFADLDRLRSIARKVGPFQIVYGGKAHPQDEPGKEQIRHVFRALAALKDTITGVYVENYDMRWASFITSGVDLWLNTPQRPYEASGTSGMKAALNGVPSFSVPDGWWLEGHVEGATGWDIGREEIPETSVDEIAALYHKLETLILPMFYGRPDAYAEMMRLSIALNGSFFNAQRMLAQYVSDAYFEGKQTMPVEQVIVNRRRSGAS